MECLISIIIPCYNHGSFIKDAIKSVEESKANYKYEIIIINDGSTDQNTVKVINGLIEEGYKVINQKNQGLASARNNGIAKAIGKYIIPLDSDNRINENYLNQAIDILNNNPSIDVVYGNSILFGEKTGVQKVGDVRISEMLDYNRIDACAVFKKTIWQKVGGYDGNMPAMGNEDWEFWIKIMLNNGKLYHLDKVCFDYRVVADSMTITTTRPAFEVNKEYIYKKHCKAIIKFLLDDLISKENALRYIKEHKIKALCKIATGRKI